MSPSLRISLALCLLSLGCIGTTVQRLDVAPRAARSPDSVTVLTEPPDQPYTVLAVVSTRSSTVFDSFDDLRAALLARAALLGGDAVIPKPRSKKTTPIFNTVGFVQSEQRILTGNVITRISR